MKIRNGFVSNSSSSSFVINKKNLRNSQINNIFNHIEFGKKMKFTEYPDVDYHCEEGDSWKCLDNGDTIEVYTMMDNFDMYDFLIRIGVDEDDIERGKL